MGKVLYGIKNVYYAKLTESDGTITYGTPAKLEGATGFSPSAQGDTTKFYADDKVWYVKAQNNGYEGDLTLAYVPDAFLRDILGRVIDANGAVVENSGDQQSRFALMFEAEGDPKARRYVYWDCTASRPTREHNTTEDSITVGTDTMTITMNARSTDNAVGCYMEKTDENTTAYNAWFSSVYEKTMSL